MTPEREVRVGWSEAFEESAMINGTDKPDDEWLDLPLDADDELDCN